MLRSRLVSSLAVLCVSILLSPVSAQNNQFDFQYNSQGDMAWPLHAEVQPDFDFPHRQTFGMEQWDSLAQSLDDLRFVEPEIAIPALRMWETDPNLRNLVEPLQEYRSEAQWAVGQLSADAKFFQLAVRDAAILQNQFGLEVEADLLQRRREQGLYQRMPLLGDLEIGLGDGQGLRSYNCPEDLQPLLVCGEPATPIPYGPGPFSPAGQETLGGALAGTFGIGIAPAANPAHRQEWSTLTTAADIENTANAAHRHDWRTFATTVGLARPDGIVACSGVLVGPRHILTAAHCLCGPDRLVVAHFGDRQGDRSDDSLRFSLPVIGNPILRTGGFCAERASWIEGEGRRYPAGDLAILGLGASLPLEAIFQLLPAESLWSQEPHGTARVAGFGHSLKANATGMKNYATVEIVLEGCLDDKHACRPGLEIVARPPGGEGSADSCSGDSGGPLFVSYEGQHFLAGIVSRGIPDNPEGLCGKGGVYADLRNWETRAWLRENLY